MPDPGWLIVVLVLGAGWLREFALRREAEAGRDLNKETVDALAARNSNLAATLAESDAARIDAEVRYATVQEQQQRGRQTVLTKDERDKLLASPRCVHCGGVHGVSCPRVKRLRLRANGDPLEVEFWPDGAWTRDYVLFPEDYPEQDEALPQSAQDAGSAGGA